MLFRPYARRSRLERSGGSDRRRQRVPLDRNCLGGVARLRQRVGDHERERIADMAHRVPRQDRIGWNRDLGVGELRMARQVAEPHGIGGGEHQGHARHRAGLRRIDDAKARMRVRRTYDRRMEHPRGRQIGDIAAIAAQQRVVLLARERLAETEFDRSHAIASRISPIRRASAAPPAAAWTA